MSPMQFPQIPSGPAPTVEWDPDDHIYRNSAVSVDASGAVTINSKPRLCLRVDDPAYGVLNFCSEQGSWIVTDDYGVSPQPASIVLAQPYDFAHLGNANRLIISFDNSQGAMIYQDIRTTGINKPFIIQNFGLLNSGGDLQLSGSGTWGFPNWTVEGGTGHFYPNQTGADLVLDIGKSTKKVRTLYVGNVAINGASTLYSGSGAPAAGTGANGDFYFRFDTPGTANQRLYVKSAGAWVAIL
jgi:hypothetical protein